MEADNKKEELRKEFLREFSYVDAENDIRWHYIGVDPDKIFNFFYSKLSKKEAELQQSERIRKIDWESLREANAKINRLESLLKEQKELLNSYENDVGKLKVQKAALEEKVKNLERNKE